MNTKMLSRRFATGVGIAFGVGAILVAITFGPSLGQVFSGPGKTHAQGVGSQVSTPANFGLHLGTGIRGATMPYDTDIFEDVNGPVPDLDIYFTITRPDSSTVSYSQKTDNEGRIRGQVYASVLNQTGTYTMTITGPPAISGKSGTFAVKQYTEAP